MSRMPLDGPWLGVAQGHWESRSLDHTLPGWFRLYSIAMARAEPNLHSEFRTARTIDGQHKPGDLSMILGKHHEDGTFTPLSSQMVSNTIKQAVDNGLLDPSSKAACLVLPAGQVASNLGGNDRMCATHHGKQSVPRRFYLPNEESLEKGVPIRPGQRLALSLSE